MLKVSQQEYIKFLREFEGLSISEIKERLDINWRTAKNMQIEKIGMSQ